MKIISIIPLKNFIELQCVNSGQIFYYKPTICATEFKVGQILSYIDTGSILIFE